MYKYVLSFGTRVSFRLTMRQVSYPDFDPQILFEGELSCYQKFFNYWYCETLVGKLKHDFSSRVWELAEKCTTLEEFWEACNREADYQSEDTIDARNIRDSNTLACDFHEFADNKIDEEDGWLDTFYCEHPYLQDFVLPECYRLAKEKVQRGTSARVREDYREEIERAMHEAFAETSYARDVQQTVKERYQHVADAVIVHFV